MTVLRVIWTSLERSDVIFEVQNELKVGISTHSLQGILPLCRLGGRAGRDELLSRNVSRILLLIMKITNLVIPGE